MSVTSVTPNTAALLSASLDDVKQAIRDLRELFETHDRDERAWRDTYFMRQSELERKADSAHFRIDVLERDKAQITQRLEQIATQLAETRKIIDPLVATNRALVWVTSLIGGALVLGILSFLWSVITHQVIITVGP